MSSPRTFRSATGGPNLMQAHDHPESGPGESCCEVMLLPAAVTAGMKAGAAAMPEH